MPKFTVEDKLRAVKRYKLGIESINSIAKPVEGSMEALQAENERLSMENAYLKKLNALVQEKEVLQRKSKHK